MTFVSTGDNYCHKCGDPLIDGPSCRCGRVLHPTADNFCPRCGLKVEKVGVVAAEPGLADLDRP